jgi:alkaline phosphatase D
MTTLKKVPLLVGVIAVAFSATQALSQNDKPLSRIAFGSCARQDRPQPIWDTIVKAKPDLFLFIGDNIYADTTDIEVMRTKYAQLRAIPGYQRLLKSCPVLAVWDDHDYGANDSGADYPKRVESQQVFLDFFDEPVNSPRRKREGIYDAKVFGPPGKRTQIILLDTRYFRSPLKRREVAERGVGPYVANTDPNATVLGEAQWIWLEQQLRQPAELRIIASSIQLVAEDQGWEKWMNFPKERERLFELLRATRAGGVVVISGDRHLAELSMMDGGIGYPVYDLTSSSLNSSSREWRKFEVNRHRIATMNWGDNFGLITVDWSAGDPGISLQIRDAVGEVTIQQKLYLSTLQPGTIKPSTSR